MQFGNYRLTSEQNSRLTPIRILLNHEPKTKASNQDELDEKALRKFVNDISVQREKVNSDQRKKSLATIAEQIETLKSVGIEVTAEMARKMEVEGGMTTIDFPFSDPPLTALMIAAKNRHLVFVKVLLEAKANPIFNTTTQDSALTLAATYPNNPCIQPLLEAKADVNHANRIGFTALMGATAVGDAQAIKTLLAAGAKLDPKNNVGDTALTLAIGLGELGSLDCVRALVEAKADVNYFNSHSSSDHSCLMLAAEQGNHEIIKLLVQAGALVDTVNSRGASALFFAVEKGLVACIKALLEAKADLNIADKSRQTVVHVAIEKNQLVSLQLLIEAGAKLELANQDEKPPLFIAAMNANEQAIDLLLDAGANVNYQRRIKDSGKIVNALCYLFSLYSSHGERLHCYIDVDPFSYYNSSYDEKFFIAAKLLSYGLSILQPQQFHKWLGYFPKLTHDVGLFLQGEIKLQTGEECIEYFEAASKTYAPASRRLGWIKQENGFIEEAVQHYIKAVRGGDTLAIAFLIQIFERYKKEANRDEKENISVTVLAKIVRLAYQVHELIYLPNLATPSLQQGPVTSGNLESKNSAKSKVVDLVHSTDLLKPTSQATAVNLPEFESKDRPKSKRIDALSPLFMEMLPFLAKIQEGMQPDLTYKEWEFVAEQFRCNDQLFVDAEQCAERALWAATEAYKKIPLGFKVDLYATMQYLQSLVLLLGLPNSSTVAVSERADEKTPNFLLDGDGFDFSITRSSTIVLKLLEQQRAIVLNQQKNIVNQYRDIVLQMALEMLPKEKTQSNPEPSQNVQPKKPGFLDQLLNRSPTPAPAKKVVSSVATENKLAASTMLKEQQNDFSGKSLSDIPEEQRDVALSKILTHHLSPETRKELLARVWQKIFSEYFLKQFFSASSQDAGAYLLEHLLSLKKVQTIWGNICCHVSEQAEIHKNNAANKNVNIWNTFKNYKNLPLQFDRIQGSHRQSVLCAILKYFEPDDIIKLPWEKVFANFPPSLREKYFTDIFKSYENFSAKVKAFKAKKADCESVVHPSPIGLTSAVRVRVKLDIQENAEVNVTLEVNDGSESSEAVVRCNYS